MDDEDKEDVAIKEKSYKRVGLEAKWYFEDLFRFMRGSEILMGMNLMSRVIAFIAFIVLCPLSGLLPYILIWLGLDG